MNYDELAKAYGKIHIKEPLENGYNVPAYGSDTKESEVIWSNRWQTAWRDLATIKLDLSDDILENLNILITKDVEQVNIAGNPEAYEYYLKGQFKWKNENFEDLKVARAF